MKTLHRDHWNVPVLSWCENLEPSAFEQISNLASHPAIFHHVALMPDCHTGYGMPIGGVIACDGYVIPNAVGVDIGCGMCAVKTSLKHEQLTEKILFSIIDTLKQNIPVGEGRHHRAEQKWAGFDAYLDEAGGFAPWFTDHARELAYKGLGSLGGGNHFLEIQKDESDYIWLMLHSGSRNLGYTIASYYHEQAKDLCNKTGLSLPSPDLACLPEGSSQGKDYIRDMGFALSYAKENRARMLAKFFQCVKEWFPEVVFDEEINIHHNYAAKEHHFDRDVWVHRKGATAAAESQWGIIPGSMGTSSYIVKGKGNPDSFCSCSHGAGRVMGRNQASFSLDIKDVNEAMKGIVFSGWKNRKIRGEKRLDLGEAPQAYKDIHQVIADQNELVEPVVVLKPLAVVKG
jgi:tRNA-splicing ligase RtcB